MARDRYQHCVQRKKCPPGEIAALCASLGNRMRLQVARCCLPGAGFGSTEPQGRSSSRRTGETSGSPAIRLPWLTSALAPVVFVGGE